VPVVVPTQLLLRGDEVVLHLARANPVWAAIEENPTVLVSVAGDWAYIPSSWKVVGDEDPRLGIPTTYYAAVQLVGAATVVDDAAGVAEVLRLQLGDLQPEEDVVDPSDHGARLRAIRGAARPGRRGAGEAEVRRQRRPGAPHGHPRPPAPPCGAG
jgi:transcriptional regulator